MPTGVFYLVELLGTGSINRYSCQFLPFDIDLYFCEERSASALDEKVMELLDAVN